MGFIWIFASNFCAKFYFDHVHFSKHVSQHSKIVSNFFDKILIHD
jgi:hypothetical protein